MILGSATLSCMRSPEQKITEQEMEDWINSIVTGDLLEVPGIGAAAVRMLGAEDVEEGERILTTHQLIGKYLALSGPGETTLRELNEKFWYFLRAKGIGARCSDIVEAISAKVASLFPDFVGFLVEDDE
jgi:hypothetical protein